MQPTEMEEYLFDLRGYIVLKNAVDVEHLVELNEIIDTYHDLEPDGWRGWGDRARASVVLPLFAMGRTGGMTDMAIGLRPN